MTDGFLDTRLVGFWMTATMKATLLSRLAATIMVGAGEVHRSNRLHLWRDLIKHHEYQIGRNQSIPYGENLYRHTTAHLV